MRRAGRSAWLATGGRSGAVTRRSQSVARAACGVRHARRAPRHSARCLWDGAMALLNVVATLMSALLFVQSPRASEYQVKAVFLFNFGQFVEWPAVAAPDPQMPVII